MAKRKIVAQTQNDDWTPPKVRKKRKPMTAQQRVAAAERLEKARAAKSPAKNQSIHPDVIAKPDDHPLCAKNVKSWLRSSKEQLTALRSDVRRDVKGAKAKFLSKESYIRNIQHYLKHGDWVDDFYGEYEEKKVQWRTIAP
jgi:hypothetical protein|tara:strand:- start:469 stop:891 length:423 start_codon:yes stop_codon:yes gene_type:complete